MIGCVGYPDIGLFLFRMIVIPIVRHQVLRRGGQINGHVRGGSGVWPTFLMMLLSHIDVGGQRLTEELVVDEQVIVTLTTRSSNR